MNTFKIYNSALNYALGQTIGVATSALGSTSGTHVLHIFGGVPPTAAQFATWVSANIPTIKLITFNIVSKAISPTINSAAISNIPSAVAINAGVATWFLACSNTDLMLMGDITDLAGTGAFRLNNTNIVTGQSYVMQNLVVNLPYTYTF